MWIHKGYFEVKKLVWNVRIKDFRYLIHIFDSDLSDIQEIFKMNVSNHFLSTKSSYKLVLSRCEFTKVILKSKSWCKIFLFWYTNNIATSGFLNCPTYQYYWKNKEQIKPFSLGIFKGYSKIDQTFSAAFWAL